MVSRRVKLANGRVTFRYRDYADSRKEKLLTLWAEEFLRRFVQHVLPKGFMKIRHYGLLASRQREACLRQARRLLLPALVQSSSVGGAIDRAQNCRSTPLKRPIRARFKDYPDLAHGLHYLFDSWHSLERAKDQGRAIWDAGAQKDKEPLVTTENTLPEFNWYLPQLAVGGRIQRDIVQHLGSRFGINRIVDLRIEDCDDVEELQRYEIAHLHLPTLDMKAVRHDVLWQGVHWVREGLDRGEKILIHCEYGIGRSVLLACCVLVSLGHTPSAAMANAKRARPRSSPSLEQLQALLQWSADWHRQQALPCPRCTWNDLAAIAYSDAASCSGTSS